MKLKSLLNSILMIILLFGGALFFTGCEKEKETLLNDQKLSDRNVFEQVEPVLQTFLNTQYDYVIGKSSKPEWSNVMVNQEDANRLQKQIDEHKKDWRENDEGIMYDYYTSDIQWQDGKTKIIKLNGNRWKIVEASENYTLRSIYIPNNSATLTEGGYYYSFIVVYKDSNWKIESYEEIDSITIIPGDPVYGHRWHIRVPDNRANIIVPGVDDEEVETRSTSYNRTAAKNYAHAYWNSPNTSAWCDYTNNGGDCTNFVSQCLYAGGWTKQNGSYCSNSVWYHNGAGYCWNTSTVKNYSCSWTQANNMYGYLSNSKRVYQASYPLSYYQIGDVVQLLSGSNAFHTMLITKKEGTSTLYVTYRTATGYDQPRKDFLLSNITNTKLYWRLKDSY